MKTKRETIKVGLAQMAPVWLDRRKTIAKICEYVRQASKACCDLVVFGEGLLPGYPFWVEHTEGARFESDMQKELYAHYVDQAVNIKQDHLAPIQDACRQGNINIITGCIEAANDRSGHSVYCTLLHIDRQGDLKNAHRKLVPTYEERLVWAQGDGHGLRTFNDGAFTIGGLNCWENWMPLARSALYAQGEDLHVAIWPGNVRNTEEITRFIARESRSFVISVSGLLKKADVPSSTPYYNELMKSLPETMANGGSCICGPNGNWVLTPQPNIEQLYVGELDHREVRKERQNFDPSGHYSRPDVTRLTVDRTRQSTVSFED